MKRKIIIAVSCLIFLAVSVYPMPSLAYLGGTEVSIYDGSVDKSWYDSTKTEFSISSAAALAGLAEIVNSGVDSFDGKYVYLEVDIVWNEGDASTWASTPPKYKWIPIGVTGTGNTLTSWSNNKIFRGTFNGQGHVISGLYIDETGTVDHVGLFSVFGGPYLGNLSIVNSYISARARIGAFAGIVYGPHTKILNVGSDDYLDDYNAGNYNLYENLYTDAYIHAKGDGTHARSGGIFGIFRQNDVSGSQATAFGALSVIRNCWSNATVTTVDGARFVGGITANIVGVSTSTATMGFGDIVLENCLTTASLNSTAAGTGGFTSEIYRTDVHFVNCVSALREGKFDSATAGAFSSHTTYSDGFGGRIFTEGGYVVYPSGLEQIISSATSGTDDYSSVKDVDMFIKITGLDSNVFDIGTTISLKTVRTSLDDSYTTWLMNTGYEKPTIDNEPSTSETTAPKEVTSAPDVTTKEPELSTTEPNITIDLTTTVANADNKAPSATDGEAKDKRNSGGCSASAMTVFSSFAVTASMIMIVMRKKRKE